jgi:polysaccharide biosynthesis/export protein
MTKTPQLFVISIFTLILILLGTQAFAQGGTVPFSTNPFSKNPITSPFGNDKESKKETKKEQTNKKDAKKEAAENVLNANKKDEKSAEDKTENKEGGDEEVAPIVTEDKTELPTLSATQKSKIYGMDFFQDNSFALAEKIAVSPPPSYRLGIGDEVVISVWGNSQTQQTFMIGRDGSIFPPLIGKIYLQGMSYANAKNVIINKYSKVAPGSNIDMQMGKIRTIKVSIIGEVKKQGTVTVSAFTTAINALSNFAGGITDLGNLRKIEIKRNGEVVNTIDLYEFIKNGGSLDDQYLEDGDFINVGTYEKLVKAEGSFKRPMYYQLKENEQLSNLIDWAGGPEFDARFSSVIVKSIVNEEPRFITLNLKDYNAGGETLLLLDGDVVEIKKVNANFGNTVEVSGAVNYPDIYQVKKNDRLLDLILKAGGLVSDAILSRAYVYRGDSNFNQEAAKINLSEIITGKELANMEIMPGDRIMIISKKDFIQNYNVEIVGSVRKPIVMPFSKNMTLKDLLFASGGLTNEAENGRIEIASSVDSADNFSMVIRKKIDLRTIVINPNLVLDESSERVLLRPNDKVYVRKKIDFKLLEKVTISGEINYPGEYALLDGQETILQLIERAGQLKNSSFLEGAIFTRPGEGDIGINLKEMVNNPKSKYNLVLRNGDNLFIPKRNELVKVNGQVIKALSVVGDVNPMPLKNYISEAGGYGEDPWKDRISVTYPNGKTKTVKRIFFIRKYPKVTQGCVINVPKKPAPKDRDISWKDITSFTTSFVASVTTLVSTYLFINKIK